MDFEEKNRETQLDSYKYCFFKLWYESDRLSHQLLKTGEENYAKTLNRIGKATNRITLDKLADLKQNKLKARRIPRPSKQNQRPYHQVPNFRSDQWRNSQKHLNKTLKFVKAKLSQRENKG